MIEQLEEYNWNKTTKWPSPPFCAPTFMRQCPLQPTLTRNILERECWEIIFQPGFWSANSPSLQFKYGKMYVHSIHHTTPYQIIYSECIMYLNVKNKAKLLLEETTEKYLYDLEVAIYFLNRHKNYYSPRKRLINQLH